MRFKIATKSLQTHSSKFGYPSLRFSFAEQYPFTQQELYTPLICNHLQRSMGCETEIEDEFVQIAFIQTTRLNVVHPINVDSGSSLTLSFVQPVVFGKTQLQQLIPTTTPMLAKEFLDLLRSNVFSVLLNDPTPDNTQAYNQLMYEYNEFVKSPFETVADPISISFSRTCNSETFAIHIAPITIVIPQIT